MQHSFRSEKGSETSMLYVADFGFAKFIDILKEDEIRVIYTVNRVYMTL